MNRIGDEVSRSDGLVTDTALKYASGRANRKLVHNEEGQPKLSLLYYFRMTIP